MGPSGEGVLRSLFYFVGPLFFCYHFLMRLIRFFDKLEDHIREWLSRNPILYALVGAIGVVLFWRGVWHTADFLSARYFHPVVSSLLTEPVNVEAWGIGSIPGTVDYPFLWDGAVSLIAGTIILLVTGLLVSNFIGDHIIISGLRREKKLAEKTEGEVEEEETILFRVHKEMHGLSERIGRLEKNSRK